MDKAAISAKNRFFLSKIPYFLYEKPPNAVVGHSTCDSLTTGTDATIAKTEAISLFKVMFRKSKRKLTYLQIICKSVSFLDESRDTLFQTNNHYLNALFQTNNHYLNALFQTNNHYLNALFQTNNHYLNALFQTNVSNSMTLTEKGCHFLES